MSRPRSLLVSLLLAGSLAAQTHICTISDAGESCATLTVTMTPQGKDGVNDLVLRASGLHPHSHGGMIWGMYPTSFPVIPGSACLVFCDYVWGHPFMTDNAGEYKWSRAWPGSFHGYFYMQMGSISIDDRKIDVKTTSCKLVQCLLP